jgi:3-oxoacyl-[acyl-carrier-protein] synthase III
LRPDDVAAVAAAPFDVAFVDELRSHLGVEPDRVVQPGPARWHTAGLVAALDAVNARPIAPGGEWILLVAAGAGISAGAALLRR